MGQFAVIIVMAVVVVVGGLFLMSKMTKKVPGRNEIIDKINNSHMVVWSEALHIGHEIVRPTLSAFSFSTETGQSINHKIAIVRSKFNAVKVDYSAMRTQLAESEKFTSEQVFAKTALAVINDDLTAIDRIEQVLLDIEVLFPTINKMRKLFDTRMDQSQVNDDTYKRNFLIQTANEAEDLRRELDELAAKVSNPDMPYVLNDYKEHLARISQRLRADSTMPRSMYSLHLNDGFNKGNIDVLIKGINENTVKSIYKDDLSRMRKY